MAVCETLFVCGSLCQGMVHWEKISNFVVDVKEAEACGSIFRLPVGYPVLSDEGNQKIPGQLLRIEGPELLLRILDEFHGHSPSHPEKSLFFKKTIQVTLDGNQLEARAYCINPAKLPRDAKLLDSGDWLSDLKQQPPLPECLTERQMTYIRRLGASTGRDIVPIDLQLYRELMKLELIVDKGRRLALTKLGKEVYHYLPV